MNVASVFLNLPLGGALNSCLRLADWFDKHDCGVRFRVLSVAFEGNGKVGGEWLTDSQRHHVDTVSVVWDRHDRMAVKLAKFLELAEVDVLLPNPWDPICMAATLLREKGLRTVGVVRHDQPQYYDWARKYWPLWDCLVGVSQRCVDVLGRSRFHQFGPIQKISSGVPIPEYRRRTAGDCLRMVFSGRLCQEEKRARDLIGFVHALEKRAVPFHLDIFGDGAERDRICNGLAPFIGDAGAVHGSVRVHGAQPAPVIYDSLLGADLLVLFSESEGTPNAVMEAMACGAVPLMTKIDSGVSDTIEEGVSGFTFPVGNVDAAAETAARLWERPDLRERVSRAAYKSAAERHSVDAMANAFRNLFERLPSVDAAPEALTACRVAKRIWEAGASLPEPPLLDDGDICRRMQNALEKVAQSGAGPAVLYGAGAHTRKALPALKESPVPIVGILDDCQEFVGTRLEGFPVLSVDQVGKLEAGAVILSSDRREINLWRRLGDPRLARLQSIALHEDRWDPEARVYRKAIGKMLSRTEMDGRRRLAIVADDFWFPVAWDLWRAHADRIVGVLTADGGPSLGWPSVDPDGADGSIDAILSPHPSSMNVPISDTPHYFARDFIEMDAYADGRKSM